MQRTIARQIKEIERLQAPRVWVPVVGALAICVVGGGLVEIVRNLT